MRRDPWYARVVNMASRAPHGVHGLWIVALLTCASASAGCSDLRTRASADESASPARGGTLEIVGGSDVDHLAATSAYVGSSIWLLRTFTRQLVAYPPAPDLASRIRPAPDLAIEIPTRDNGGISADGLSYTFRLRRGVRWNTAPPREVSSL